mmetsp:Transcript_55884/g.137272  ORF Transcript_55884/g.137272 Transcript_55884/m.137272 type:complete len:462 (-) Transcript_55884:1198-2583(-)
MFRASPVAVILATARRSPARVRRPIASMRALRAVSAAALRALRLAPSLPALSAAFMPAVLIAFFAAVSLVLPSAAAALVTVASTASAVLSALMAVFTPKLIRAPNCMPSSASHGALLSILVVVPNAFAARTTSPSTSDINAPLGSAALLFCVPPVPLPSPTSTRGKPNRSMSPTSTSSLSDGTPLALRHAASNVCENLVSSVRSFSADDARSAAALTSSRSPTIVDQRRSASTAFLCLALRSSVPSPLAAPNAVSSAQRTVALVGDSGVPHRFCTSASRSRHFCISSSMSSNTYACSEFSVLVSFSGFHIGWYSCTIAHARAPPPKPPNVMSNASVIRMSKPNVTTTSPLPPITPGSDGVDTLVDSSCVSTCSSTYSFSDLSVVTVEPSDSNSTPVVTSKHGPVPAGNGSTHMSISGPMPALGTTFTIEPMSVSVPTPRLSETPRDQPRVSVAELESPGGR